MDMTAARRCHSAVSPLHGVTYFAPEPADEFAALGLERGASMPDV